MLNKIQQANQAMQQRQKLQKLLSEIRVTGQSKNSKVTVTMTGDQKIVDITIDPSLIKFVHDNFIVADRPDTMMGKSIIEAVDDAITKVQTEVVKKMQENGGLSDLMDMLQTATSGQ
jgi:DNA-binding protein YbaB